MGRFTVTVPFYNTETGRAYPFSRLFFFLNGTQTPKDTFANFENTVVNPNPVVSDGSGQFPNIFLDNDPYSVEFRDRNNVTIWRRDDVRGQGSLVPSDVIIEERQTLTDGKTLVTGWSDINANLAAFYISNADVDQGRLTEGSDEDYTVNNATTITLNESYPNGTTILALQFEPTTQQSGLVLDDLDDVEIDNPQNDEALIYETSSTLWKNKAQSGNGGGGAKSISIDRTIFQSPDGGTGPVEVGGLTSSKDMEYVIFSNRLNDAGLTRYREVDGDVATILLDSGDGFGGVATNDSGQYIYSLERGNSPDRNMSLFWSNDFGQTWDSQSYPPTVAGTSWQFGTSDCSGDGLTNYWLPYSTGDSGRRTFLWKTVDGGNSFEKEQVFIGLTDLADNDSEGRKIVCGKDNPDIVFFGFDGNAKISTDGADNFVDAVGLPAQANDACISRDGTKIACTILNQARVFYSTNNLSFTELQLPETPPSNLQGIACNDEGTKIFVSCVTSNVGYLWKDINQVAEKINLTTQFKNLTANSLLCSYAGIDDQNGDGICYINYLVGVGV